MQLNEALRAAEELLTELGLGVSASVQLQEGALSFERLGGGWHLVVRKPEGRTVLLTSMGRETRIEGAKNLSILLERMRERAAHLDHDLNIATKDVLAFNEALLEERNRCRRS